MPALARFLVVFAATIAASATIGKLVPHIPRLAADFDISLGAAGFLVSAPMLPGALTGPLFGALVDRFPPARIAVCGLMLEAAASAALPFAPNLWAFLGVRLAEGVGYMLIVVAGTPMIVSVAASRHRSVALATWSSFAPLGFALGQLFAADASYRSIGVGHGLALFATAGLLWACIPAVKVQPGRASLVHALQHAPALRTALAFGCVTGMLLGAVALAPLVLSKSFNMSVAEAARLAALAALPGIVGRFASGWLLGKSTPRAVFGAAAAISIAAVPLALLAPVPLAVALIAFAVVQICAGSLAGLMQAMLPRVAPSPAQLGTVTGLANQMVNIGNLTGPPLTLAVYAAAGDHAANALLMLVLFLSVWLVFGVGVYRRAPAP